MGDDSQYHHRRGILVEGNLQHNQVRQLERVLGPGAVTTFPPLAMLLQGTLQVSREDVDIDDVLCAVEGEDKQVQGGGWGHGGRAQCGTAKEDGGVSGDVNGALKGPWSRVRVLSLVPAVIGGPRPECGL